MTTRAFVLEHTTMLLVKQLKIKYQCEGYFWRVTRNKTIRGEKRVEITSNRFWLQTRPMKGGAGQECCGLLIPPLNDALGVKHLQGLVTLDTFLSGAYSLWSIMRRLGWCKRIKSFQMRHDYPYNLDVI